MNEEHSSNQTETTKKSFFQSLIGRFFQGELKNREELVEVIRDSEQNDLIDQNTREMIEGVMEIAELRVRDIMIPRSQIVFIESNQDCLLYTFRAHETVLDLVCRLLLEKKKKKKKT